MEQTAIIKNWIDDNSQRLAEIKKQNPSLNTSIVNVLDYINNYYGGTKIETESLLKEVAIETPEILNTSDFRNKKIAVYNREDRLNFEKKVKEKGYKLLYTSFEDFYVFDDDYNLYGVSQEDFLRSDNEKIFLQDLGLLEPFVKISWSDELYKFKFSTENSQESKELIEMFRRLKSSTPNRKDFTVRFSISPNVYVRHNYFEFLFPYNQDDAEGVNSITSSDKESYDKSLNKVTFQQFKRLFDKNNTNILQAPILDISKSKIIALNQDQSIAIQNKAFELGYNWASFDQTQLIQYFEKEDFPVAFYFDNLKQILDTDYGNAVIQRYKTNLSFKPLSLYDLGILNLGNNVVLSPVVAKTTTKTTKSSKKSITLHEQEIKNVKTTPNDDDFSDLLDELDNLEL
jgi:hypothetical protein